MAVLPQQYCKKVVFQLFDEDVSAGLPPRDLRGTSPRSSRPNCHDMIRAVPTHCYDSIYFTMLAQYAAHAMMDGHTGLPWAP